MRGLSLFSKAFLPYCAEVPAIGVGHPDNLLPDVWRTEARNAKIERPDGVVLSSQISRYKVEPEATIRALREQTRVNERRINSVLH